MLLYSKFIPLDAQENQNQHICKQYGKRPSFYQPDQFCNEVDLPIGTLIKTSSSVDGFIVNQPVVQMNKIEHKLDAKCGI